MAMANRSLLMMSTHTTTSSHTVPVPPTVMPMIGTVNEVPVISGVSRSARSPRAATSSRDSAENRPAKVRMKRAAS